MTDDDYKLGEVLARPVRNLGVIPPSPAPVGELVDNLAGPHEWGYRDVTDGTFIPDAAPFKAAARIKQLEAENERLREQFVQPIVDYLDGGKCLTDLKPVFDAARAICIPRESEPGH
jgi:hypothetical protein